MLRRLGWLIGLNNRGGQAKKLPDAKPHPAKVQPVVMLDTVQEIAIYIHRFHYLDLFHQGWYQIKITVRWDNDEHASVGTPARVVQYEVGFHHYLTENFTGETLDGLNEQEVLEFDPPSEVRALIEGQFLSMRAHTERFGMPSPPKRIIATGGASANQSILSSIASIFGWDIYTVQRPDSASLGAALRAAHGWLCSKKGSFVPISSMYKDLDKTSLSCKLSMAAGDQDLVSKYALLMKKRFEIENRLVQKLGRC